MNKITLKLTKYFLGIITFVVILCFIASSVFLSKFYMMEQYNNLENSAKEIYTSLNTSAPVSDTTVSAILIKDGHVTSLTHGKMGMMPMLQNLSEKDFNEKGKFKNSMGSEFLYYKLERSLGDIVVFQNNSYSNEYLSVVYIVLFFIFIFSILLCLPLISFIGKRFTKPILQLKNAAEEISQGNFDFELDINSKDEIETLSKALVKMSSELKKKYTIQRDFVANVSHDFKTPLSVIRSYSEAINDNLLDDEERGKYSLEIIKEVDSLNNLVVALLQLSKFQHGGYALNKKFINLPLLMEECINKFTPIINKKNISIELQSLPVDIFADKEHIQRVFYNFIDNALKFSNDNGRVKVVSSDENTYIRLSVIDNGMGIEPDFQKDIWNRYYKNARSGGMGLGLPICSEILKLHGFTYGVNSSPKDRTEFFFLIPKKEVRFLNES
ncbi:HAMP domain-containing sensor histidine kinase [Clostridium sp.]|uniref:sensor histidine kinase n=1 Tax=Clostridium sp. TaxID=1506 RepID=UPI002FCAFB41